MKIDTYVSSKNGKKFVSTPADSDPAAVIPATVDPDYLVIHPVRKGYGIDPAVPVVGLDVQDTIAQIQRQGYALHQASITITVQQVARRP